MLYLGLWAGMLENYCHICNQRPLVCLIGKFRAKIRILKNRNQKCFFGCFVQQFRKTIVIFETNVLKFVFALKFDAKKSLHLEPKMPDLRILGLEFQNIIVIFEISVLEFVFFQSLVQKKKKKSLNLGPKMSYLGILGLDVENNIAMFEISSLEFL